MSSNNIIQFRPYQLLGNLKHVLDQLLARVLVRPPSCPHCGTVVEDNVALAYVKRLHELHKETMEALEKARLEEQLEHSVTLELAGRSPEALRREKS